MMRERDEGPVRGLKACRTKGKRRGHWQWFAGLSMRLVRVYLYVAGEHAKTKMK
jgi:hypothetical protein